YSWAKQMGETRVSLRPIRHFGERRRREPQITGKSKALNVQRPDRPDFHSRPRTARGEFVSRQQPEDELAASIRRASDRTGDGGGLSHRGRPASALAALLFHPSGRSANSDHL